MELSKLEVPQFIPHLKVGVFLRGSDKIGVHMAVFVKIGDHWINPLNVAYLQMVTVEQEIKETMSGKTDVRKEQVTAVEIVTLVGDHECNRIRLDGGADIVAVAKELSLGMNAVPTD